MSALLGLRWPLTTHLGCRIFQGSVALEGGTLHNRRKHERQDVGSVP